MLIVRQMDQTMTTQPSGKPDSGINQAQLAVVTAYDKANADRFRRLKRKKWVGEVLGIRGEWSQTIYHQGDVVFSLRSTADGRFWALYTEGFVRKIQAVVEAARETCAEEVAAEAMQAVKDARGPYVDLVDDYGDLEPEQFRSFQRAARERSKLRRQALQATAGKLAATAKNKRSAAAEPARPRRRALAQPPAATQPALPKEAAFLCTVEVPGDLVMDKDEVTLHLHRADGSDTLWITSSCGGPDAVGSLPTEGSLGSAGLRLVEAAMHSAWHFGTPQDAFTPGLLTKDQILGAWSRVQAEDERLREEAIALTGDRPIVALARELRLAPEPSGTGPASWYANCPGGHHHIYIQAESGEFGCGYCKRKGGVEELRAFAATRRV